MPNDSSIPYGGGANPFGKPQAPTGLTYGDLYNNWTGYSGGAGAFSPSQAMTMGDSFNFSNPQYNVTTPNANLSSDGYTGMSNTPLPQSQPQAGGGGANPMQSVLGLVQVAGGVMGAKKLQKEEYPSYKPISALQQAKVRSGQFAQMGYTPEQTANFRQDLARIGNEDYLNAINLSGGSLSRALNSRRNTMRFGALNQFAQGDAAQRMSNIRYDDSITGQLQSLANMETQNKLQRRIMLEQAYGQAIKTGTENITNSFDSGQALKMIAGGM